MAIDVGELPTAPAMRPQLGVALLIAMCCMVVIKYAVPKYRRYRGGYQDMYDTELTV